jgi:hypothetical protein
MQLKVEHVAQEFLHLMADRSQERGKDHAPSTVLPLTRLHLLKFPLLLKITPSTGDQVFNTCACGGHFIFKPNEVLATFCFVRATN